MIATPLSQSRFPVMRTLSLGTKFFLLVLLALLMSLSGFLVEGLTAERAGNHGLTAAASDNPPVHAEPAAVLGIPLADSYRSTRRSLHYITLFLGLVFLTYFLFEITAGRSVHPAQYALVGVAQTVFYLLLLSLAEICGFDVSFLIAGGRHGGPVHAEYVLALPQPASGAACIWHLCVAIRVHLRAAAC